MKKSDTEQIRAANRVDIINTLRVFGPLARVDIGQRTRLSPATVTAITSDLVAEGVIREVQKPVSATGRGRPRVLIGLNPDHASALGIKLSINEIRLMLGDLQGNIVAETVVTADTQSLDQASLNDLLVDQASRFLEDYPDHARRLVSLGVAIQGIVDAHRGYSVWSPALSIKNVNMTAALEAAFECPVELANDTNCIAHAIHKHPEYLQKPDFAVIMIGYGVGGSLILNGDLYSGHNGAAAEFGHTKYTPTGPTCACGKAGCIEAYVADYALYRDARALIDLPETDRRHPSEDEMRHLTQLARDGSTPARELFDRAGRVLGFGIANVLALISPERVVVTGPGVRAYDLLEDSIQAGIQEALIPELVGRTEIQSYPWSEDMTGKGVIALALGHFR
ncbi:ROK family protein [Saccharospirillum salsuginis]|uniref:Transcriptional regulator n=1 Tax=Saccharospirillum salsuginis TaxID=418750 RepID=A0A918K183_9GAMM|nr:ROK family protein [Saccharospirillum salsuginis]GGX42783.1 transcriptional regulator [Saccharospirillum salsuginis]